MPIFEYHCERCQDDFEQIVFNTKSKVKCPHCQSQRVSKKVSAFSFKVGPTFASATQAKGCIGCKSRDCSTCH